MRPDLPPAARPETPSRHAPEPLTRVSSVHSRGELAHTSVPSVSSLSLNSNTSRPLLGRLASRTKHAEEVDDENAFCGFLKKSTGPWSVAWWSDAMPTNKSNRNEPGRGWRPFKVVLARDTLYFYKVPSVMVPEVRSTFQVRAAVWPAELEEEAPLVALDDAPASELASSDTLSLLQDPAADTPWEQPTQHPDLHLVPGGAPPASWAARIEHATGAALAHELVFATQRPAHGTARERERERDERAFLHIAFYALGTSSVPFDAFLQCLHSALALAERLGLAHTELGCVRRVSLFLDLLLWKRPLLQAGHEAVFFREAEAVAASLARTEPEVHASLLRQLRAWRESCHERACSPTDWLHRTSGAVVHCAALQSLDHCWSGTAFLARDALEIAQQIQCFHADRLATFLRVPVTAYRLASTVSESLLRSFRFDASRPHWLTHVCLRQVLVDDALERQDLADRALVLVHWAAVGRAALRLRDMAAWAAIAAALCSRPVACMEALWRRIAPDLRAELQNWAQQLAALGWIEGVHTLLAPRWSAAGTTDPSAVPFFGNAGLIAAATPHLGRVRAATQVRIAAQEPEFNRVRALAQHVAGVYQEMPPPPACATPILEYQCLFQRLAQHEYPLHTSVTDYLGSALLATGLPDRREEPGSWPEGAAVPLCPTALPAALPPAAPVISRSAGPVPGPGGWAALPTWLARYEQRGEEVPIGDALHLRAVLEPPTRASIGSAEALAAPLRLRRLISQDLSVDALADLARPAEAASQYTVEVAFASVARMGTAHLVVRSPLAHREPTEYRVLQVALDLPAFRDAVLLAHADVLPSVPLFEALRLRWEAAEHASREMAWHARGRIPNQYPSWAPNTVYAREPTDWAMVAEIRYGVLDTLQRWLTLCPCEFVADPVLFETAHAFLCEAAEECDASFADVPQLARLVASLRASYPHLVQRTIALYAYEPSVSEPCALEAFHAPSIAAYLEAVAAPLHAALHAKDVARAARCLAHVAPRAWHTAGASLGSPPTLARLLRRLPGTEAGSSERHVSFLETLPSSVRALCDAHETIAAWVESLVAEPQLSLERRVHCITTLLDVAAIVRAHMANTTHADANAPLPTALVESAVLEGLATQSSLAQVAAWERIPSTTLLERALNVPTPSSRATPSIYWVLAWLASSALRLPLHARPNRVALGAPMAVRAMVHTVQSFQNTDARSTLPHAYARLAWLRTAVAHATWPVPSAHEGNGTSHASCPRVLAALLAAREHKRAALAACPPPAPRTPSPHSPAALAVDTEPRDAALLPTTLASSPTSAPTPSASAVEQPAGSRTAALLAAVPMERVASVFPCTGALLRVWPFERHPYVLELVLPNATRCTLKVPDYAAFSQWLARLRLVPHVRLDASFDPGEYAAHAAEHQGRASVAALFQVALRDLHARTGSAVPPTIERLLHEVETRGLHEQGIYRISGSKQAIDALQASLRATPAHAVMLTRVDIHVVSSTVKLWLRELPEPVVPYGFYDRLVDTEEISDPVRRVRAMSRIVRAFPRSHFLALERFARHLAVIARASKVNLMAPHNLGLVFGSTLLSPPPNTTAATDGFHRLGQAAHVVKILVVMHRHIFPPPATA